MSKAAIILPPTGAEVLHQVLLGDVMAKVPFGGMFVAEDLAAEQGRFDRREIVPAGPIFGRKTFAAKADAALRETSTLEAFGATSSSKLRHATIHSHSVIRARAVSSRSSPRPSRRDRA